MLARRPLGLYERPPEVGHVPFTAEWISFDSRSRRETRRSSRLCSDLIDHRGHRPPRAQARQNQTTTQERFYSQGCRRSASPYSIEQVARTHLGHMVRKLCEPREHPRLSQKFVPAGRDHWRCTIGQCLPTLEHRAPGFGSNCSQHSTKRRSGRSSPLYVTHTSNGRNPGRFRSLPSAPG